VEGENDAALLDVVYDDPAWIHPKLFRHRCLECIDGLLLAVLGLRELLVDLHCP
jgi:hypothetical protein